MTQDPYSLHGLRRSAAQSARTDRPVPGDKLIQRNERLAAAQAELQDQRRKQAVSRLIAQIDNQSRQPEGATL